MSTKYQSTSGMLIQSVVIGTVHAVGLLAFYTLLMRVLTGSWSIVELEVLQMKFEMGAVLSSYGLLQAASAFFALLEVSRPKTGAASGVSTGAMIACCAHHVTDLIPFFGFLQVFSVLSLYQSPLMYVGAVLNLAVFSMLIAQNKTTIRNLFTNQALVSTHILEGTG